MMDRDNITRTGAKDPWGREARASRTAARRGAARLGLRARPEGPQRKRAKGRCKPSSDAGMPGAGLTAEAFGKARSDRLALKPYRGKPAVRNFREGDGDVGIMRSPLRAIALPALGPDNRPRQGRDGEDQPEGGAVAWPGEGNGGRVLRLPVPFLLQGLQHDRAAGSQGVR